MSSRSRCLRFAPTVAPLVGIVVAVTLIAALSVVAHRALFGASISTYPEPASTLLSVPFMTAVVLVSLWFLRREGVDPAAIGLSRRTLLPGILAFGVLWGCVSVAGLSYLLATGQSNAVGFVLPSSWPGTVTWFLLTLTVANGLPEELVFRGYVQNKVAGAVSGNGEATATAVGIVVAAVLFGIPHAPVALFLLDLGPEALPAIVLSNLVPGVTYGLVYWLTRNLWYTSLVHGFGNAPFVPLDPTAVPYFVPFAAVSGLLVGVGYRRWARGTDRVTVEVDRGLEA